MSKGKNDGAGARRKTPFWVLSSYFAEGFPLFMLRSTIPYFLKNSGRALTEAGSVQLLFIPWTLKFLWAPLVDVYSTKKRWIIGTELAIAAFLVLMAVWMLANPLPIEFETIDGVVSPKVGAIAFDGVYLVTFLVLVFLGCTLSATQDIAIDGAYVDNLTPHQQEAWAGTRVAAYRLSKIVGTSLVIVLAGLWSWPLAMLVAAGFFVMMALLHSRILPTTQPAPPSERRSPAAEFRTSWSTFVKRDQAGWILLFALTFKLGDGLLFSMNTLFVDDLGVSRIGVGILGTTDTLCTIGGALFGAWVIMKVRLSRALIPLAILFNSADLLYAWFASLQLDPETAQQTAFLITGFEQFVGAMGTAAYSIAFVFFARGKHAASHFALLTAIMGLEMLGAGPVGGFMADTLGWQNYFIFCFGMGIPGILVAVKILPTVRRIEAAESTPAA